MVLIALAPFALFLYLLLIRRKPLLDTAYITLTVFTVIVLIFWQISWVTLVKANIKGFLVALDIFFIIFGAILFLDILKKTHILDNIFYYLEGISPDYRILTIILAWFLENFLEGTAGFGTPSTVVAPLLVAMGLPPLRAVAIALLGNSTSVAFGAAGTPIRVGFSGLETTAVPIYTSLFNLAGLMIPAFMLYFLVEREKNGKEQFWEALPFAIWSGIAFVLPSYIISIFGQEFPSILGAVIGLLLVLTTIKLKLFLPKTIRRLKRPVRIETKLPWLTVALPYGLLIFFLILGKFALSSAVINIPLVNHSINFFNPGFIFILVSILVLIIQKKSEKFDKKMLIMAFKQTLSPFLVIAFMSIIVQLITMSGDNNSGLPSITKSIADIFSVSWLPLLSPFVGAFGSFITGSATISNLMFGSFIFEAASGLGLNGAKILALELVGAAAGNMIALSDILAAETVVKLKNKEVEVVRLVILPCMIYLITTGLWGMLFK